MAVMVQDLVRVRGGAVRRPTLAMKRLHVAVALSIFFAIVLLDAMLRPLAGFDLPLITRIQAVDFPRLERYLALVSDLTGSIGAIGVWALAAMVLATRRIWSA